MARSYMVKHIFGPTLQGEGPRQGMSCVFLRLSGCNAWDGRPQTRAASACPYCDTDFFGGSAMDVAAIRSALSSQRGDHHCGLVISGGEPLLQLDHDLLDPLTEDFPWIDIETNGTRPAPQRAETVQVVCSPKAIGGQPLVVQPDAWKILIPAQQSFLQHALDSGATVYVQPVCPDSGPQGSDYAANLQRCIELCHRHGCRLSLQLHKYLGLD